MLSMRETRITRALREVAIFNPHGFYNESGVLNDNYPHDRPVPPVIEGIPTPVPFISYRPEQRGRASQGWAWQVHRAGRKTDPDTHWMNYGNKTFDSWEAPQGVRGREAIDAVLAQALAWATQQYGIKDWAKDPYGGYGPAEFIAQRLAQLLPAQREGVKNMGAETTAAPAAAEEAAPRVNKDGSARLARGTASPGEVANKDAWLAYQKAQKEGDKAGMEANRPGYKAYRQAANTRRKAEREASTAAATA